MKCDTQSGVISLYVYHGVRYTIRLNKSINPMLLIKLFLAVIFHFLRYVVSEYAVPMNNII